MNKDITPVLLRETLQAIRKLGQKRFAEENIGISLEQHHLLRIISEKEEFIQSDLACILEKDKSAVMRQLDQLEELKLIVRVNDTEDRRKKFIILTKKGNELMKKGIEIFLKLIEDVKTGISEDELATFQNVLKSFKTNAEKLD